MATLSRSKTKAMYSWWWDSHISPKNSKWLKENLTDMDTKVKTMIKLIEVDEDSFVRRAEVYFKRRPELMKLVEEFYRAYRALAERYDHATGVIRHAHKTMSEAFPDQIPSLVNEDGPINIIHEADETPSSRQGSPEPDDMPSSKGSRQLNGIEKARKELNFQDPKPDSDIQTLREAIAKLEAEKEAGLVLYRETLERLAKLESEFCEAKEDSRGLCERACKAEAEVESLKESLVNVEAEREGYLLQYQQCLARILDLEGRISRSEQDSEALKEEIARVKAEKEALLGKYLESLEKIANLENKLLLAKDYSERAQKEVEELRETIVKLTEEKEAAVCRYEECLEKIAELERRIAAIEEEAERSNKSLQSEVDSLVQKVGVQDQELSEKQKELGRLWTCVQEERMRFTDAENAFQSLQNLHSKVQEELRSVAGELQKKVHLLKEMEVRSELLEDEVQKAKDENRGLQDDIFVLKDEKGKLEQELELRVEQRNALQQEIYSLKEELNRVAQIHQDAVAFGKGLEEEHSKLEERCRGNEAEIAGLVEKLSVMEKLIEKNELLENSLGNLRAELNEAREKVESLEESCQLLMGEKSVLISQLQITTENLEKLADRNSILENSLLDANVELEMLRVKSKNLEDSCKLLNDQNSVLVTEKQSLAAQLETTQQKLEVLGKTHADLEERFTGLEEERESTLRRVEELQGCLEVERKEHSISNQLNGKKITDLESRICVLQEAGDQMRQEFEEELDKAVNAQFDIFLLRRCIHELRDKNASLMGYCEKLQEASRLSEKLISELEHAGHEKQEGLRALSGEIKGLRRGMFELLEAIQSDHAGLEDNHVGYDNEDQRILHHILGKLDDIKISLSEALDENQALVVEKSVLLAVLWQLKKDVEDLNAVILILKQEIGTRNDQIAALQKEMQQLWENNEELIFKVREGNQKEAALLMEMEILQKKLFDLQRAYDDLQEEKCKVVEDRDSLKRAYGVLQEEKDDLEHECCCIVEEAVALDNLSFVFKNVMSEKARQVLELSENVDRLGYDKGQLVEKMRTTEGKMEEILAKNIGLEALLKEAENQLGELKLANDELKETLRTNEMEHLKEHKDLCDTIENLEAQVSKISKEYGTLSSELEKGKDTIELWETMACTFFAELQSACVREAMIKEKFYELIKEYEVMEEESRSKGEDIVELQERVGTLEGENSEIKARLAADSAAIMSLRDSVASLEKHTTMHRKLGKTDEENKEVTTAIQLGEHIELQDVQGRIRAVEKAVIELKKRSEEQHSSLRNDLELAMRQILKLKSPASSRRGSKRFSQQNPEEGLTELLMKDIELDRVSSGHSSDGLVKGRKKTPSNDGDQRFEFWESIENQGGHIDIKADKNRRRENRSSRPSSELTVEKELLYEGDPQQQPHHHQQEDESRRKFLERLVSDVEKLNSLQLTVQDLMATADKSGERGTTVRDQLAEKEKTIQRLIEFGGKLVKKIEKSPSFDDSATSTATTMTGDSVSEEIGSGRRRSCREQAKRMSEKIGRLQHEVQKIQFDLLMKLDKDNSSKKKGKKGGTRVPEWNSRVLLRDFLYGPAYRTPPKRRFKTRFCACVRPSTIED